MECLKFFSLSSGVVSVSPTMVVLWWARRLERGAQENIFEAEWTTWPSGTSRFEVVMKKIKGNHSLESKIFCRNNGPKDPT